MSNQYPGGLITKSPVVPNSIVAPGIWTLSQQAAAQATNTWPFPRDPYFSNVTMLLHGDGSAQSLPTTGVGAGASAVVTPFNADASTNNFNVTINGDARSNNFSPYLGTGYYSNYFDGTSGQYLNAPANTVFNFGTGDFTVEAWVLPTSTSGTRPIIEIRTTGGANGFALLSQSGATTLNVYTNGGFVGVSTNSLTLNAWNHVALTRSGNTWTYWINGVSGGSFTNSSTQSDGGTTGPKIGGSTTSGEIWIGYISNARITKGGALYTTTFTPSTTPLTTTVSSGTVSLLTSQSNRFIDNSVNAFTITVNGSPQVSPAQPFTLPSSVATYGSGYFDGTGDYLTLPVNSAFDLGTNACCVESWVYLTSTSAIYMFATSSNVNGQTRPNFYARYDQLQLDYFGNVIIQANVSVPQNSWNHVVFTRASSSGAWRIFLNGVLQAYNATGSQNLLQTGAAQLINSLNGSTTASGYITDLRVVNGSVPSAYVTSSTTIGAQIFTPPTAPLTAVTNTSVLTTQYNGAGNNNGFKDSSQNNFVITRNGNTTQGTFTPYEANWSNYFNGSSYINAPANAAFAFGTGSWTVEAWVYVTTLQEILVFDTRSSASTAGVGCRIASDGTLSYSGSANNALTSTAITANTWNHIAWVYNGTTLTGYINGVSGGTATPSFNISQNNGVVGRVGFAASGYMLGYISNLRVVKGTAVYTSTFTPSVTPLTAITNTSLLTCQSNRFIDNSTNAFTITVNSSPTVQSFSPFVPLVVYNPAVNGGSAYFDGSGDYLSIADANALDFAGDFTVEAWVFVPTTSGNARTIIHKADTNVGYALVMIPAGNIEVQCTSLQFNSTSTLPLNQWNHVAMVRSGSGTNNVKFYLNGVLDGQGTNTTDTATAITLGVGAVARSGAAGVNPLNGYISNVRLVASAVYTSAFTPSTTPLTAITNTSLLLNYTNAGILDNAMMNDLETVGNAQISTSVKKYGTGSMYFDGSGDCLLALSNPQGDFGSGNFTLEGWFYQTATTNQGYFSKRANTSSFSPFLVQYDSSQLSAYLSTSGSSWAVAINASTNPSTNTWNHVAFVRNGSTATLYLNGTSVGSASISGSLMTNSTPVVIGAQASDASNSFNGYIDDLRITKGVARYTTTFTVPDQAFPNG